MTTTLDEIKEMLITLNKNVEKINEKVDIISKKLLKGIWRLYKLLAPVLQVPPRQHCGHVGGNIAGLGGNVAGGTMDNPQKIAL